MVRGCVIFLKKEISADRIKMLTESNETFLLNRAFIIDV
jgi:hypothetical protein